MAQLRRHQLDLETMGAEVRVITFDGGQWADAWLEQTRSPWPLLHDPERKAYRLYGLCGVAGPLVGATRLARIRKVDAAR